MTKSELAEAESYINQDSFLQKNTLNMFRLITAYFYETNFNENEYDMEISEFIFQTKNGTSLRTKEEIQSSASRLTHIFVHNSNFNRNELKATVKSFETENIRDIKILNYQWIIDCHEQNENIPCDKYIIPL